MDDLVKYRLDNAKERLSSAKLLLDAGNYRDSSVGIPNPKQL